MTPLPSEAKGQPPQASLHFGRCELRLGTRELLVDGQPQPVRRLVFDLIAYLVAQRPRAVPHAEALREVWQRPGVSQKMLARAVMEARRACGDSAENPEIILSVHGVGYRFVGMVAEGPLALDASAPAELVEVRDLLRRASARVQAGQLDEARSLAERALQLAGQAQSQTERVHALVQCSTIAMRGGTAAAAAKLAAQALQIARGEGQPQLVAQARMAVGFVHLVAGDRVLAARHLEECREALSAPGFETDLKRCLNLLSMAFRDSGNAEAGLKLCRRALELARHLNLAHEVIIERNNEVMFLLRIGDARREQGLPDQARVAYEEALVLVDALLGELMAAGGGQPQLLSVLGNRAFALERLGRLDEAWQAFASMERELARTGPSDSPIAIERRWVVVQLRATLLADSRRFDEALHELAQCFDGRPAGGPKSLLPRLCAMAADIAQRAGRLEEALQWTRRQMALQTELQAGEAASLASILEAELNSDELQDALDKTRAQVAELRQENEELRRQLRLVSGSVPVSPSTRLAHRDHLDVVFSSAHLHARARGLPMCLGVLELVNLPALRDSHPPPVLQSVIARAAEQLGLQPDISYPAVEAGDGQIVFHILDAGPSRAIEVCEAVLAPLRSHRWVMLRSDGAPQWRCRAIDAAKWDSPQACIQELLARATASPAAGRGRVSAESAPDSRRSRTGSG